MTAFISAHGLGRSCLFPPFEVGSAPLQFPICPSSALCPLPIPSPGLGPVFLLRVQEPVPWPHHCLAHRRHSCTVSRLGQVQGVWAGGPTMLYGPGCSSSSRGRGRGEWGSAHGEQGYPERFFSQHQIGNCGISKYISK